MDQLIKAAARFVSKDPDRRVLNGILHDVTNQVLVATDGRRIIVIPAKLRGKDRVIAAHNIKEIPAKPAVPRGWGNRGSEATKRVPAIKKGNRISGDYPRWQMVVPSDRRPVGVLDVPASVSVLEAAIAGHALRRKELGLSATDEIWVAVLLLGCTADFDARFLLAALLALTETGAAQVTFEMVQDQHDPIVLTGDNGAFAVIMPARGVATNSEIQPLVFKPAV